MSGGCFAADYELRVNTAALLLFGSGTEFLWVTFHTSRSCVGGMETLISLFLCVYFAYSSFNRQWILSERFQCFTVSMDALLKGPSGHRV